MNLHLSVILAVTLRCNSRCLMCDIWKRKSGRGLSPEIYKKLPKSLRDIDITGGKPFLRNDLVEIIKVIKNTCPKARILITTNGLLTEKITRNVKEVLNLGPKRLIISIAMDGPARVHDQLRGIKGNWKRAVATYKELKKLRSKRFDCFFGMTLSGKNYQLIEETYQELRKDISGLDRNDLHFNIAHYSFHYYQNLALDLGIRQNIGEELVKFNRQKKPVFSGVYYLEKNIKI